MARFDVSPETDYSDVYELTDRSRLRFKSPSRCWICSPRTARSDSQENVPELGQDLLVLAPG